MIAKLFKIIISMAVFCAVLFLPAGTLIWPEAWALMFIFFLYAIFLFAFILKDRPRVVESRKNYKPKIFTDKILLLLITILTIALLVLPGLDVFRFHWSGFEIPLFVKYIGVSFYTLALILFAVVLRQNAFLSRIIEVQADQTVVTTGLYAYVRHPMYMANALFYLSFPLALGSLYTLIVAILLIMLFYIRTFSEEKKLIADLPGYSEYMKKVKYRMFPGVW